MCKCECFFSKCDKIYSFLRVWSHLLRKSLMENFISCAVSAQRLLTFIQKIYCREDNSVTIHHRKMQKFGTEIFKAKNAFSLEPHYEKKNK